MAKLAASPEDLSSTLVNLEEWAADLREHLLDEK